MTKTEIFGEAWATSMEYQLRYYLAGVLAIPIIMAVFKLGPLDAAATAMIHGVAAPFVTFPGAMIVNYLALQRGRPPERSERRRVWTSAVVAVLLTWTGYSLLRFLPYPPPDVLVRTLGEAVTMLLYITGCTMLSSTIGLIVGWSLPTRGKADET